MKTETIAKFGRIKLEKLDDQYTPYLFTTKEEGEWMTATPACVQGEGEIEGVQLNECEFAWVCSICEKLDL